MGTQIGVMSGASGKSAEVASSMEGIISPAVHEMSAPVHQKDHTSTESASPSHVMSAKLEHSTWGRVARRFLKSGKVSDAHGVWKSGKVLNMMGIEEANLPFDIKLRILKEYLRLWASWYSKLGGPSSPTNHTVLMLDEISSVPQEEWAWTVLPVGRSVPRLLMEKFRLDHILSIGNNCASFRVPLERFFFGHMLWQFGDAEDFRQLSASEDSGWTSSGTTGRLHCTIRLLSFQ